MGSYSPAKRMHFNTHVCGMWRKLGWSKQFKLFRGKPLLGVVNFLSLEEHYDWRDTHASRRNWLLGSWVNASLV